MTRLLSRSKKSLCASAAPAGAVAVLSLSCALLAAVAPSDAKPQEPALANWPQWRGPLGAGVAPQSSAPLRFDADTGVKWKVALPGRGRSSPIVWNDLVFVTTAVPTSEVEPSGDRPRRREPRLLEHDFRVLALRRDDGSLAWSRTAATVVPHEGFHRRYSSLANPSPVTDGERVYAFFGSRGLYAYGLDGDLHWERDFGVEMETFGPFGEAATPALHGDFLVVVFDHQAQSFIEAVDRHTGETLWKTLRESDTSWSSPFIVEHLGGALVVVSGSDALSAYDLATGDLAWTSAVVRPQPIPTPVAGGGLLFAASRAPERRVQALDLGTAADGAVAARWELDDVASYSPSPMLWDGELYVVRDGGLSGGASRLSVLDAATGEPHYMGQRLPSRYTIKASPVGADGRVYLATEEGDVLVIRRGGAFEVLATNAMGEPFIASPAIAHGELFLRGVNHLFCISAD